MKLLGVLEMPYCAGLAPAKRAAVEAFARGETRPDQCTDTEARAMIASGAAETALVLVHLGDKPADQAGAKALAVWLEVGGGAGGRVRGRRGADSAISRTRAAQVRRLRQVAHLRQAAQGVSGLR
jgi:hypothetical protein